MVHGPPSTRHEPRCVPSASSRLGRRRDARALGLSHRGATSASRSREDGSGSLRGPRRPRRRRGGVRPRRAARRSRTGCGLDDLRRPLARSDRGRVAATAARCSRLRRPFSSPGGLRAAMADLNGAGGPIRASGCGGGSDPVRTTFRFRALADLAGIRTGVVDDQQLAANLTAQRRRRRRPRRPAHRRAEGGAAPPRRGLAPGRRHEGLERRARSRTVLAASSSQFDLGRARVVRRRHPARRRRRSRSCSSASTRPASGAGSRSPGRATPGSHRPSPGVRPGEGAAPADTRRGP